MQVRLFGPVEVDLGDGALPRSPSASKVRQLLAMLASEPGRLRSVDSIIDCLWGDASPSSAANLVQGYVSDLRRLVGAARIERKGSGYLLAVDAADVDVARFEQMLAEARRAIALDPAEGARLLDDCVALVRGPLCSDIAVHGVLAVVKVRIDEAVVEAEELRAEAELACGRHQGLVPRLEGLVAAHPLREAFWAQLAISLYRCGRQTEALRRCQEVRALLRDEVGVTPGARLLDVEQRIARQDPSLDATPAAAPPAGPSVVEAPPLDLVVGRHAELERMKDRLQRSVRGQQQLLLLGGEPGIGKSTLAAELGRRAKHAGVVVLHGRCDEQVSAPYLGFVSALSDHVRTLPPAERDRLLDGHQARAATVLPAISLQLGAGRDQGLAVAEPSLLERFETLTWLLNRVRGDRPLVLILDDLQWADSTTIGLLSYVVTGSRLPSALILATYRNTEVAPDGRLADLLATMRSNPQAERMLLGGLRVDDIRQLVDREHLPDADGAAEWIEEETGGNPLFIRELLRHVRESGRSSGVPDGVAEVVGRRIRRLSGAAQVVLGRAAVLGNEFSLGLLRAMTTDIGDLGGVMSELARSGMLEDVSDAAVTTSRFTHATIRRTVTDLTSTVTREELHLRAASALAALDASGDAVLGVATHLVSAGSAAPRDSAIGAFIAAATYADKNWAKAEAVQWYDRALKSLPADDERRRSLRLTRFVSAQAAWHWHHDRPSIAQRVGP